MEGSVEGAVGHGRAFLFLQMKAVMTYLGADGGLLASRKSRWGAGTRGPAAGRRVWDAVRGC